MKVDTIVSADLSGIGNASGHPVMLVNNGKECLFLDVDVSHSVTRSIAILLKVNQESLSFEVG